MKDFKNTGKMINEEHNENKSSFGMERYRYSIGLDSDESINTKNPKLQISIAKDEIIFFPFQM